MTWQENLEPASFRGVEFFIDTNEISFGRRNILHEYPLRDVPFAEDLGRKASTISVSAYVIGTDYIAKRDALISAIRDKNTPGTLILPTSGALLVIPQECRKRFSNKEGGIEYLELSFVEAGENKYPDENANSKAKVEQSAESARTILKESFAETFTVKGAPAFVSEDAAVLAGQLSGYLQKTLAAPSTLSNVAAELVGQVTQFDLQIPTLITKPLTYAQQSIGLVQQVEGLYTQAKDAYQSLKGLLSYGNDIAPIPTTTATRRQQQVNRDAMAGVIKRSALVSMAVSTTNIDFDSYQHAARVRDELAGLLDAEIIALGDTDDDTTLMALQTLRSDMVTDISTRAASLKRVKTVTYAESMPALVASYELYDTPDLANDLVKRNNVRHPGFLLAGRPLEALV